MAFILICHYIIVCIFNPVLQLTYSIALGLSVVLEGIFSALYHVCPSKMNFQFGMFHHYIKERSELVDGGECRGAVIGGLLLVLRINN